MINPEGTIDLSGRKCPKHNAWIQSIRMGEGADRYFRRYCPRCDLERLTEEMKKKQEAGTAGFIPRIGKI